MVLSPIFRSVLLVEKSTSACRIIYQHHVPKELTVDNLNYYEVLKTFERHICLKRHYYKNLHQDSALAQLENFTSVEKDVIIFLIFL